MVETKKFYFTDSDNLSVMARLEEMFTELKKEGLESCIIGGQAVSANYLKYISDKVPTFDLKNVRKPDYLRSTSDIDIIVNGSLPKNFYSLIAEYFGRRCEFENIGSEVEVKTNEAEPVLSFHFTDESHSVQTQFYKEFAKNAQKIELKRGEKNVTCTAATPIDLLLMKLKACAERADEKKNSDIYDIYLMHIVSKKDGKSVISEALEKAERMGYDRVNGEKINKALTMYKSFLQSRQNTDKLLKEL